MSQDPNGDPAAASGSVAWSVRRRTWVIAGVVAAFLAGAVVSAGVIVLVLAVSGRSPSAPSGADVPRVAVGRGSSGVSDATAPAAGDGRFTLKLGQGFRFADAAVVISNDERPDVVFKYVPPQRGGPSMRFNALTGRMDLRYDAEVPGQTPIIEAEHVGDFDAEPDLAHLTTGDLAACTDTGYFGEDTRYWLVQGRDGGHHLLRLAGLEAEQGHTDAWSVSFTHHPVSLPLGSAGGQVARPMDGTLLYRDWSRREMIVEADLSTGDERAILDGTRPTRSRDGARTAYLDAMGRIVVAAAGRDDPVATIRFDGPLDDVAISPDGTRLLVETERRPVPDPTDDYDDLRPDERCVAVLAVDGPEPGSEVALLRGGDDAAWMPDGRVVATAPLTNDGLLVSDAALSAWSPLAPDAGSPTAPAVSPDGRTVAFETGGRVWLIGLDGAGLRQLWPDGRPQDRPAFSPDGRHVAFVCRTDPINQFTGEVFVCTLDDGEVTPLRTRDGEDVKPDADGRLSWTP